MTDTPSKKGAISRASSQAAAAETETIERARRQRQAREAIHPKPEAPKRQVRCRVLRLGDGLISQGRHAPGIGEAYLERGEEFTAAEDIAEALEARGFAEILGTAEPAPGADDESGEPE